MANVESDGVEINSTYNQFIYRLRLSWNLGGYSSAYSQAKTKVVDVKDKYGDKASLVVSIIPIVGEGYDIITLIEGKDPITREPLGNLAKALTFVGLASGYGSGKAARDAGNAAIQKIADDLGMSVDEVKQVATEVAGEYKVDSIQDIIDLKDKLKLSVFESKVRKQAGYIKLTKLLKPIKSVDMEHINLRHRYDSPADTSKFTSGLDIESLIRMSYSNSDKRLAEATSGTRNTIKIETYTGNIIGTSNGKDASILRIIVDYEGNIITSYPIDKFSLD